jgi:ornithine cyclodeaminase/thiomorpholine-carboxylate dehydrogenase
LEKVLWITEEEVEELLDLDELIQALLDGFSWLSAGKVVGPDRPMVTVPNGYQLSMAAYRPGSPIVVKLVSVFHGNVTHRIPGHLALICVFDSETGATRAVMDGTYVTAIRTAGAAAVSTQLLARIDAKILAVIGAGVQGQSHIRLFPRVRNIQEIRVASLSLRDAQLASQLDERAHAVRTCKEAVEGADIVALCTTSQHPVISPEWLKPGAHVTSVGYMPPGSELDLGLLDVARLFVETRIAFEDPPAGCAELADRDPNSATEVGEVILGIRPGRTNNSELTLYKAMGHAIEDLVTAEIIYRNAIAKRRGRFLSQYKSIAVVADASPPKGRS